MKVLVVLSRFPWPLEKGDKLRAYHQIKGLAERHEVHLICLNETSVPSADLARLDFCKSVQVIVQGKLLSGLKMLGGFVNGLPFQVNYYRSVAMKKAIAATIRAQAIDTVFVQLVRLGQNLPFDQERRWVLDYMDTFSIGMRNRAEEARGPMKLAAGIEAQRLHAYETRIAAQFDDLVIISERDRAGLVPLLRESVHVIPNGVNESFFEAVDRPAAPEWDIIFFGNMGYQPNVQSARWLVEEVLPLLHQRGLRPRLCLAGARPAAVVKAFAGPEVTVTGYVDDLRHYVARSRISVAPLVGGQGLQNKLLESLAMGLPTVTTPLANAGMGARAGVDLLVCADAAAFADGIAELLANPEKAAALGASGRRFVEEHFRWATMNARLEAVLAGKGTNT